MKTRSLSLTKFLSYGLLTTSALVVFPTLSHAIDAQTGWAINRVASASSGNYCTMAQKYKDASVVTIAKNPSGEYSLAFDFPKPVFEAGKQSTASIRVGGAAQTFQVSPQSDKVAVIGLGSSDKFIGDLKKAGKFDLEVSGTTYPFNAAQIQKAADELSSCIASMKAAPIGQKAVAQETAPQVQPQAQQISSVSNNEEIGKIQSQLSAAEQQNKMLQEQLTKVTQLQQASELANQQSSGLVKENAELKNKLAELTQKQQVSANSSQQLAQLQKENADLKIQMDAANQTIGKMKAESELALKSKSDSESIKSSLATISTERDGLKKQLEQAQLQLAEKSKNSVDATQLTALQTQNADLKTQIDTANQTIGKMKAESELALKSKSDSESIKASLATISTERDGLKKQLEQAQLQLAEKSKSAVDTTQLATLQTENTDLKTRLDTANQQVGKLQATVDAQSKAPEMASSAPVSLDLQKENDGLKQEIAKIQEQLKLAQSAPASNVAPAPDVSQKVAQLESDNAKLKADLEQASKKQEEPAQTADVSKDLRNQLEIVETQNASLKKQLDDLQNNQNSGQIKQVGNNWDLEQATRRYQEAQREIRRLGAIVDQQQTKCTQEKKDIEAMLFDPAVAKSAQVAMYGSMQNRISELEGQVRSAGLTPVQSSTPINPNELANVMPAAGVEDVAQSSASMPVPEMASSANALKVAPVSAEELGLAMNESDGVPAFEEPKKEKKADIKKPDNKPVGAVITPKMNVSFQTQQDFANMLKFAGINVNGGVQAMNGANSDLYKAFRWKTDSLFGSAEQRATKDQSQFQASIDEYLSRAKKRCGGDFAAEPASIDLPNAKGYEIACIGGKTNTSASVLFSYNNQVMTTIAHEGRSEAMGLAIEARDRMVPQIGNIKTASR